MMWFLGVLSLLAVSASKDRDTGLNSVTFASTYTTASPTSTKTTTIKIDVFRSEHVKLETDVNLTCSNTTWNEMLYTIWNIDLKGEKCQLGSSDDGRDHSSCKDGKVLFNTSNGEVHLHIPNFTKRDEGVYFCESIYKGGAYSAHINVSLIAPPHVSAWLEREGSRQVAVCLAAGGKPAASVVWRGLWNSSADAVQTNRKPDGSVESRLVLPGNETPGSVTCVVRHPSWTGEHAQRLEIPTEAFTLLSAIIIISVMIIAVVTTISIGVFYFQRRDPASVRFCCQSNAEVQSELKSPPTEEAEEVEPYASYVQRVNSIYNSSADLFT